MRKKYEVVVGSTYGNLTIIEEVYKDATRQRMLKCSCVCGNIKSVNLYHLLKGNIKSCGCYYLISNKDTNIKHNKINTPEYLSWKSMKLRCLNKNATGYKNYGGRNILICDRWRDNFINFLEDMGVRPQGTSLDRIDVNGNYEPTNCRWATTKEQSKNKRIKH